MSGAVASRPELQTRIAGATGEAHCGLPGRVTPLICAAGPP